MRSIRIALAAVLAAAAPVLAAVPAQAGGPTSAMLVVPGQSRTAALYYDDSEYARLTDLLGGYGPLNGQSEPPAWAAGDALGSIDAGLTVTWLMHDVAVWRVDWVYLSPRTGPWVATTTNIDDGTGVVGETRFWRKIEKPEALAALLDELGVGPSGAARATAEPAAAQPTPRPAAAQPAPRPAAAGTTPDLPPAGSTGRSSWAGWWWGPVGLLLGAVATLAVRRRRPVSPAPGEGAAESWEAELDGAEPDPGPDPGPVVGRQVPAPGA